MDQNDDKNNKQMQDGIALLIILAMSNKDYEEGKFQPIDKAFADIREKLKFSNN